MEKIIIYILIFFLIVILISDLILIDNGLEHFGFGSWLKKGFKKLGSGIKKVGKGLGKVIVNAVKHPLKTISTITDAAAHPGQTMMKLATSLGKKAIKEGKKLLTDKAGNIGKNFIQNIKKLPLPHIPSTKLDSNSIANETINKIGKNINNVPNLSTKQPLGALLKCKGAHLYLKEKTCPPTRSHEWSRLPEGVCCNSFQAPDKYVNKYL